MNLVQGEGFRNSNLIEHRKPKRLIIYVKKNWKVAVLKTKDEKEPNVTVLSQNSWGDKKDRNNNRLQFVTVFTKKSSKTNIVGTGIP